MELAESGTKRAWWSWPRWWGWILIAILVLLIAAGGFLGIEYALAVDLGSTLPLDKALLNSGSVQISCGFSGYVPGRGEVTLAVDGAALPASQLVLKAGEVGAAVSLPDGTHTVVLDYSSSNVFSRNLTRSWSFTVDTAAPALSLVSPAEEAILGEETTRFVFEASETAAVSLTLDGSSVELRSSDHKPARYEADVTPTEGRHELALTALDTAGNTATSTWQILADFGAPTVECASWTDATKAWQKTAAKLTFNITDNFATDVQVRATLDGSEVKLSDARPPESTASAANARALTLSMTELAEGGHTISVTAADQAGHTTTWEKSFVVDSSSSFGARPMRMGAIGTDVIQLQKLLIARGFYEGTASGTYDLATAAAVATYNTSHKLPGGETVDKAALALLVGSITIDLSERKLYFYSDGQLVKTYSVAVGQPAYPTPTGSYKIISKVVDPTWTPPNSPWAAGMSPVGPGPGNPLGTRWMGISAPSVGIHGTYADSSVGTAASHGCIRMHLHQAEELYEKVFVGTPVEIVR